ncbi:protein SOSEKI 5-like [Bidens hawaiensis]|uniref:protein SOSEKI 5-like n=1 Tax=Bidens hawaiensis TaxID=980011 RepID=UPI00404A3E1D
MDIVSKPAMTTTNELGRVSRKWKDQVQRSPERTKVWVEPNKQRRVAVVYYLCRNGQLEHPHFVEVTLLSSEGLYLRDVIDHLNSLRGKGMAALYSWSSKRSYKNGFVWHDLSENDFIYPAHGHEYILKGSELFEGDKKPEEAPKPSDTLKSDDEFELSVTKTRRNQSWNSIDLNEYKVYSGESSAGRLAADASTQTDSHRREIISYNEITELSRNQISPPPSDSSTETLESLMKSECKLIVRPETEEVNPTGGNRLKASSVLMQLITCGSISFRDCGPGKPDPGFLGLKCRDKMLPRGEVVDRVVEGAGEEIRSNGVVLGMGKKVSVMEDKEYFSGSLIETKKDEFLGLKRSNSYNANG